MIVSGAYFIIGLIKIGIEKTKEKKSILLHTVLLIKSLSIQVLVKLWIIKEITGTLHPTNHGLISVK